MTNLHEAARVARDAATTQNADYLALCQLMCWDAVVYCAQKGGYTSTAPVTGASAAHFVPQNQPVTNAATMRTLPQGAFIGFFHGGTLVHAMMATGHGLAAGTKNGCVGVGRDMGWEILNLADDALWRNDGFGPRGLKVHARLAW